MCWKLPAPAGASILVMEQAPKIWNGEDPDNDSPTQSFCLLCTCVLMVLYCNAVITLRAKLYCNRPCLFMCLWVCYHDNSKLRASIFTKLGL